MDKQLYVAPCGYFVMNKDGYISETNAMMQNMLGMDEEELQGARIHSLLTISSKIYLQTYFTPLIETYKRVDEMYLFLKSKEGRLAVLMNAIERDGRYECVIMKMHTRDEYENDLLAAKEQTEKILKEVDEANAKLKDVLKEYEAKRREVEKLNEQLTEMASTDPLTELGNRRYVREKLALLIQEAKEGLPLSVLLIDIDHFKQVNDKYGHPAGDRVLKQLADLLKKYADGKDVASRLGGEEFMVALTGLYPKDVYSKAEKLRNEVAENPDFHPPITISIGVTAFRAGDDIKIIFSRADEALYHAKKNGRNRVSVR